MAVHPKRKKKKIIVQRRVSLCFFSPLLLPETWKMETENRILIGCAPCTLIPVNTLPAKKKILMETSFEIGMGDVPPTPLHLTSNRK